MQNKLDLRRTLLSKRSALAADQRALFDRRLGDKIMQWWRSEKPASLGVYWPMRGEPDVHQAYAELHAAGVQLALPLIVGDNVPLQFVEWAPGEALRKELARGRVLREVFGRVEFVAGRLQMAVASVRWRDSTDWHHPSTAWKPPPAQGSREKQP